MVTVDSDDCYKVTMETGSQRISIQKWLDYKIDTFLWVKKTTTIQPSILLQAKTSLIDILLDFNNADFDK